MSARILNGLAYLFAKKMGEGREREKKKKRVLHHQRFQAHLHVLNEITSVASVSFFPLGLLGGKIWSLSWWRRGFYLIISSENDISPFREILIICNSWNFLVHLLEMKISWMCFYFVYFIFTFREIIAIFDAFCMM